MIVRAHHRFILLLAVLLTAFWPTVAGANYTVARANHTALRPALQLEEKGFTRKIAFWPDTRLILENRAFGAEPVIVLFDGAGNITALMDGNENIDGRYLYDPFGRLNGLWGVMGPENRFRHASQWSLTAADIYGYLNRWYIPSLNRWLTRDPLGEYGGLNLYKFAGNSPTTKVDPKGDSEDNVVSNVTAPPGTTWNPNYLGNNSVVPTPLGPGPFSFPPPPPATPNTGYIQATPMNPGAYDALTIGLNANAFGQQMAEYNAFNYLTTPAFEMAGNWAWSKFAKCPAQTPPMASTRLRPAEATTMKRLADMGIKVKESAHVGEEYIDATGRSYDQMGSSDAAKYWDQQAFQDAIDDHLLKSADFVVIDMTAFSEAQKEAIGSYIDGLSANQQSKIIRVGF